MTRRNLVRLLLVLWIVALGWLARRELFPGEGSVLTAGAARLGPGARYYRVEAGDLQIGILNVTWDTLPTGFTIRAVLGLDLPAGGATVRHQTLMNAVTSRALTLQEASRTYSSIAGSEEIQARVVNDSITTFTVTIRDEAGVAVTPSYSETRPSLFYLVPLRMAGGQRLSSDDGLEIPVADLERQTIRMVRARVTGDSVFIVPDSVEADSVTGAWHTVVWDTIPARRLEVADGEWSEIWWVDRLGWLVRRETPFGVTMQLAPFEYSHLAYRDSLRLTGVAPRASLAGVGTLAASGITLDSSAVELRYRVGRRDGAVSAAAIATLAGGNQRVSGDTVVVTRRWTEGTTPPPVRYQEPVEWRTTSTNRMRATVDSALAGAATLRDSVIGLTQWVATRIARDTSAVRHRGSLLVRQTGRGNPDGMVQALMVLARTAGLTVRPVSGVAVTDSGLLAHAWGEIWTGEDWVPVDPWSGHFPASARLVRVAEGGLGRPFESLQRTAALQLDPLTPDR